MYVTWVWGPVIPAIRKLRKEDLEFKASLSYKAKRYFKIIIIIICKITENTACLKCSEH
jgi:hypothetical protein